MQAYWTLPPAREEAIELEPEVGILVIGTIYQCAIRS